MELHFQKDIVHHFRRKAGNRQRRHGGSSRDMGGHRSMRLVGYIVSAGRRMEPIEEDVRPNYKLSKVAPHDSFPSVRLHLLKFPVPSQIVPQLDDQVLKHTSI